MQWPRRGILIRLAIYVPLISILAWRAQGGCNEEPAMQPESDLEQQLAPHRRVITLPDGTQQSIVEMTPEQAEAILGHPIPALGDGPGDAAEGAVGDAKADEGGPAPEASDTKADEGGPAPEASDTKADKGEPAEADDAKAGEDAALGDGAADAGGGPPPGAGDANGDAAP